MDPDSKVVVPPGVVDGATFRVVEAASGAWTTEELVGGTWEVAANPPNLASLSKAPPPVKIPPTS